VAFTGWPGLSRPALVVFVPSYEVLLRLQKRSDGRMISAGLVDRLKKVPFVLSTFPPR
jgi:hypothetical protein